MPVSIQTATGYSNCSSGSDDSSNSGTETAPTAAPTRSEESPIPALRCLEKTGKGTGKTGGCNYCSLSYDITNKSTDKRREKVVGIGKSRFFRASAPGKIQAVDSIFAGKGLDNG